MTVADILWTVHLANKKANTFVLMEDGAHQGIDGYREGRLPPIRNPGIAFIASAPSQPVTGSSMPAPPVHARRRPCWKRPKRRGGTPPTFPKAALPSLARPTSTPCAAPR